MAEQVTGSILYVTKGDLNHTGRIVLAKMGTNYIDHCYLKRYGYVPKALGYYI